MIRDDLLETYCLLMEQRNNLDRALSSDYLSHGARELLQADLAALCSRLDALRSQIMVGAG